MQKKTEIPEEFYSYINEELLDVSWENEGKEVLQITYII